MADGLVTTRRVRAVLGLVLALLAAWLIVQCAAPGHAPPSTGGRAEPSRDTADLTQQASTKRVTIEGRTFDLELALTPEARYQGLSDRPWIAPDGGMLFVFPDERRRAFVMRRCLVPIDLIYLDAEGRVLNVHRMEVEPYDRPEWLLTRYRSDGPAQYAIELAGGMLDELPLAAGDRVDLPAGLKERAE